MKTSILVFVVEDDALIQELLHVALEDGGYEVLTASSGEEAISILEMKISDVRALITDVNLSPDKLTGWDVARYPFAEGRLPDLRGICL